MYPYGVFANFLSVLLGGLIGGFSGNRIPKNLRIELPKVFGFAAISLGILKIIETKNITVVILSLILGAIIGELMQIENILGKTAKKVLDQVNPDLKDGSTLLSEMFVLAIIAFCASGTGIFGALKEGFTGDPSILLTKSVLDFFTAVIFASVVGYSIALISILQLIVFLVLFLTAHLIAPYLSPYVLGNFTAVGGIITLMMGCRMAEITKAKVANAIPALIIVVILSILFV